MKQKLLVLIFFCGLLSPLFLSAQGFPPLTCPRIIEDEKNPPPVWTPIPGQRNADGSLSFDSNKQAHVLSAELNFFLDQTLTPSLQDNTKNVNNLMDEIIYRSRETHLCMRKICENFFELCSAESDASINECLREKEACQKDADHFFIPADENPFPLVMTLNKLTLLENQERKDRTSLYEKFQGFFVRMGQYTNPLMIKSNTMFSRFVNKVTMLLMRPN